ncbi:MAG TPA: hypothetical protein VHM90_12960 [Phycisphaerae bacterium]|nr:hypothetical protein [Phycisphaerae bacterium]
MNSLTRPRALCTCSTANTRPIPATRRKKRFFLALESLEFRNLLTGMSTVIPSSNPKSATYTDVDGDKVTVSVTKALLTSANFKGVSASPGRDQLQELNLTDSIFTGAGNPTIVASIGSIAITGNAYGTPSSFAVDDHHGFVAQSIGSFSASGAKLTLHAGIGDDLLLTLGPMTDWALNEVS